MADHVFESRVWLARPRPVVFAFFAEPTALERLTPPAFHLRLLNRDVKMATGAVLDFRLRWLGVVPLRWRAFVREWDPPFRFVDVQVRGPYTRWEHRFSRRAAGRGSRTASRIGCRSECSGGWRTRCW
jgi:ligand-binding SRPBCC domain-containing protein